MRRNRALLAALAVMALLTPVGLYLPEITRAGSAWGEWGLEEIRTLIGYAPRGMEKTADAWKAPMPGYAPPGHEHAPLPRKSAYYVFSAVLGAFLCGAAGWLIARRLARRRKGSGTR